MNTYLPVGYIFLSRSVAFSHLLIRQVVKMLWRFFLISFVLIKLGGSARLDVSNEDVVIEAIRENKNLVILFCKSSKQPKSRNF